LIKVLNSSQRAPKVPDCLECPISYVFLITYFKDSHDWPSCNEKRDLLR